MTDRPSHPAEDGCLLSRESCHVDSSARRVAKFRSWALPQPIQWAYHHRLDRFASLQLYGLTVSPGRQTHDRFSSIGSVKVSGSVIAIV